MSAGAEKIRHPHSWIPTAWPHDGAKRSPTHNGKEAHTLKEKLERNGVTMLHKSARYKSDAGGGQPTWPIIEEIKERERSGRFKVFSTCTDYLEERRNYHTKDQKIVRIRDDVLMACFYGVMMRRFATTNIIRHQQPTIPAFSTRV